MNSLNATALRLAEWEGLKARKKIAQGKASPRATPWGNRPQNLQALKGRQNPSKQPNKPALFIVVHFQFDRQPALALLSAQR